MNTYDIEFVKLLPHFMRDDTSVKGLSVGTDEVVKAIKATSGMLTTWDKIYQMNDAELDDLAWELNIIWYDSGASLDVKRELILNSDKVFQKLGTRWAVEDVISTYFGEGHVMEWFEYEGEPGHFRIFSTNTSITNEKLDSFLSILSKVKRASAHLDDIYIILTGFMKLHAGSAYHETGRDLFILGSREIIRTAYETHMNLNAAVANREISDELIVLGELERISVVLTNRMQLNSGMAYRENSDELIRLGDLM